MAVPATPPAAHTILEPVAATIRQIPPLAHPPPQTSLRTDTSPTSGSPTSPSPTRHAKICRTRTPC